MSRPAGGGGASRPNLGGGGGASRPNLGGGGGASRPNLGGGGGARPNVPNRTPSASNPIGGGSARPGGGNLGLGNRPQIGGNNNIGGGGNRGGGNNNIGGGGNRGGGNNNIGGGGNRGGGNNNIGGGGNRGGGNNNIGGGGNRGGGNNNIGGGGNRGGIGNNSGNRGGIGNNSGNRINNGRIGNNNINNIHNNINIANNRGYFNNWQHGSWNGNWNRPGGGGYWNGWANGFNRGWNAGYWHGGWGGYWHGGWGGYWGRPWYAAPIAWGLGAWAVGSIIYASGYSAYSNPYYASGGSSEVYYDYSQPITVYNSQPNQTAVTSAGNAATPEENAALPPEVQEGTSHMDAARDAFKQGDYAKASSEINLAIKALPKDAALHEFRALVFFATKDYKQAAATLYAVLSAGPGWDWTTLSGMYASVGTYTDQLRALEDFVKANPGASEGHFVLGYHYLTCGHPDNARRQFEEVLKLQPGDQLATQLVQLLKGDDDNNPADPKAAQQPTPQPPDAGQGDAGSDEPTPPTDIDAKKLVGKWSASRPDGSTFSLSLTDDSKFNWGFAKGKQKQEFSGTYSVDGAILVLDRGDGQQMPGLVTLGESGFNFKLYGGPPDDPGLDFKK
ncbi:MAG: tetratricopeptide repeat protein [Planctomycetes bacterium]|nr:tetratricopeptide repeat protein [Planctomycetota bacterium]